VRGRCADPGAHEMKSSSAIAAPSSRLAISRSGSSTPKLARILRTAASVSIKAFDNDVEVGSASIPDAAFIPGSIIPSAGVQVFAVPEPGVSQSLIAGAFGLVALRARRALDRSPKVAS